VSKKGDLSRMIYRDLPCEVVEVCSFRLVDVRSLDEAIYEFEICFCPATCCFYSECEA
jgi:hypothetical protein